MHATVLQATSEQQTRWQAVVLRAKARGWSQNRLARRLRINPGHLSRVIRGERESARLLEKAERVVAA